jgi:hypothetical protein
MSFLKNLMDDNERNSRSRERRSETREGRNHDDENRPKSSSRSSRSRTKSSRSRQKDRDDDADPLEQSKIGQDLMGILMKPAPDQDPLEEDENDHQQVSLVATPLEIIKRLRGDKRLGPPPTMSQIAKELGVEYVSNKPPAPPEPMKLPSREDDENDRRSSRRRDSRYRSSRSRISRNSRHKESQGRENESRRGDKIEKSENESKFQKRWSQFDIGNDINIPIEENDNRFGSQLRKHYDGMWRESQSRKRDDDRDGRKSDKGDRDDRDERSERSERSERGERSSRHRDNERDREDRPTTSEPPKQPNALSLVQNLRRGTPETHYFMGNLIAQMNVLAKEKQIKWSQEYNADSDPVMAYHEYKVVMEQIELVNKARTFRHKVQRTIKLAEEFSEQIPYLSIKGVTEEIEKEGGFTQYDDDFKLIALQSNSGPRNPWWSLVIGIGLVVLIKWLENVFKGQSMIGFVKKFLELFKKPKSVTDASHEPSLFSTTLPSYENEPQGFQNQPMHQQPPMYPSTDNNIPPAFINSQQSQSSQSQPEDFYPQFPQNDQSNDVPKTRTRTRSRVAPQ